MLELLFIADDGLIGQGCANTKQREGQNNETCCEELLLHEFFSLVL